MYCNSSGFNAGLYGMALAILREVPFKKRYGHRLVEYSRAHALCHGRVPEVIPLLFPAYRDVRDTSGNLHFKSPLYVLTAMALLGVRIFTRRIGGIPGWIGLLGLIVAIIALCR